MRFDFYPHLKELVKTSKNCLVKKKIALAINRISARFRTLTILIFVCLEFMQLYKRKVLCLRGRGRKRKSTSVIMLVGILSVSSL